MQPTEHERHICQRVFCALLSIEENSCAVTKEVVYVEEPLLRIAVMLILACMVYFTAGYQYISLLVVSIFCGYWCSFRCWLMVCFDDGYWHFSLLVIRIFPAGYQ